MPFGLDLKSVIVGIILAYIVIPYVRAWLGTMRTPRTADA